MVFVFVLVLCGMWCFQGVRSVAAVVVVAIIVAVAVAAAVVVAISWNVDLDLLSRASQHILSTTKYLVLTGK